MAVALVASPMITVRQCVVHEFEAVRVGEPRPIVARVCIDSEMPLRVIGFEGWREGG